MCTLAAHTDYISDCSHASRLQWFLVRAIHVLCLIRGICCWIGLSSVLRPRQHSIGYMGDGFYRSKDPTNSNKVLKEMLQRTNQTTKTTKYTYAQTLIDTRKDIHKISTTIPLVYTNTGWLGDGSHRGQVRQAWTALGLPPRYPSVYAVAVCMLVTLSVHYDSFIHSFI